MKSIKVIIAPFLFVSCILTSLACSRDEAYQQTSVATRPAPATSPARTAQSRPGDTLGAETTAGQAQVKDAYGDVQQRTGATASWKPVNVGDLLSSATTVRTGDNAAVLLLLADKHVLRVGEGTTLELKELGRNKSFAFEVARGRLWSFVNSALKPTKYEVETPSAVVGVSGTVFSVFHDPQVQETLVSTAEGIVTVRQGQRRVKVTRGRRTRVRRSQRAPFEAQPQDQPTQRMWQTLRGQESWLDKSWFNNSGALRLNRQAQDIAQPRRIQDQLQPAARPRLQPQGLRPLPDRDRSNRARPQNPGRGIGNSMPSSHRPPGQMKKAQTKPQERGQDRDKEARGQAKRSKSTQNKAGKNEARRGRDQSRKQPQGQRTRGKGKDQERKVARRDDDRRRAVERRRERAKSRAWAQTRRVPQSGRGKNRISGLPGRVKVKRQEGARSKKERGGSVRRVDFGDIFRESGRRKARSRDISFEPPSRSERKREKRGDGGGRFDFGSVVGNEGRGNEGRGNEGRGGGRGGARDKGRKKD